MFSPLRSAFRLFLLFISIPLILSHPVTVPRDDDSQEKTSVSDKYLVGNLPGIENIPEAKRPLMHAGHIEVNHNTGTNYFFWKFVKQHSQFNRTIFWLNGGPGCSSMDGALMEVGPLRVLKNNKLTSNDGSWYHAADLVFVDQPGGTGFSTTRRYDQTLEEVGGDFVTFMQKYFEKFPQDRNNDIYIAGESYAGQYIPFIAHSIFDSNDKNATSIRLKGLLIGNGWIDPNQQSLSYVPYLLNAGIIHKEDSFLSGLLVAQEKCQNEMRKEESKTRFSLEVCESILNKILDATKDRNAPKNQQCLNVYDTRLRDSFPSCGMNWPPDLVNINPYLAESDVVRSLNLNPDAVKKWRECDPDVSGNLKNKGTQPAVHLLPDLLERVNIMLFNGDKDIICNSYGVQEMISKLKWRGQTGFSDSIEIYDWKYGGKSVGKMRAESNLTYVDVFDSSHMVPFDVPFTSRGLFDMFIGNYKVVETLNSTYVETPIYTNATSNDDGNNSTHEKSVLPFVFYLGTIGLVGVGLFLHKKSKEVKSNSILRNVSNRKSTKSAMKKTVSWADENETLADSSNFNTSSSPGSKVGKIFDNFRSNEPGYDRLDDQRLDEYEDIELESNPRDDTTATTEGGILFDLDKETDEGESSSSSMVKDQSRWMKK